MTYFVRVLHAIRSGIVAPMIYFLMALYISGSSIPCPKPVQQDLYYVTTSPENGIMAPVIYVVGVLSIPGTLQGAPYPAQKQHNRSTDYTFFVRVKNGIMTYDIFCEGSVCLEDLHTSPENRIMAPMTYFAIVLHAIRSGIVAPMIYFLVVLYILGSSIPCPKPVQQDLYYVRVLYTFRTFLPRPRTE